MYSPHFFPDCTKVAKDVNGDAVKDENGKDVVQLKADLIMKNVSGGAVKAEKKAFKKSVRENPLTLHVIIRDECHYEAARENSGYKFLNDDELRLPTENNVIGVFVSATPYSTVSADSQIPEEHEVKWRQGEVSSNGISGGMLPDEGAAPNTPSSSSGGGGGGGGGGFVWSSTASKRWRRPVKPREPIGFARHYSRKIWIDIVHVANPTGRWLAAIQHPSSVTVAAERRLLVNGVGWVVGSLQPSQRH